LTERFSEPIDHVRSNVTLVSDDQPKSMMSVADVATAWSVSEQVVRKLLATGRVRGVRIGGQWRVSPAEVARVAAMGTIEVPSDAEVVALAEQVMKSYGGADPARHRDPGEEMARFYEAAAPSGKVAIDPRYWEAAQLQAAVLRREDK
jgi:excisionase family DNA binding protein